MVLPERCPWRTRIALAPHEFVVIVMNMKRAVVLIEQV